MSPCCYKTKSQVELGGNGENQTLHNLIASEIRLSWNMRPHKKYTALNWAAHSVHLDDTIDRRLCPDGAELVARLHRPYADESFER